MRYAKIGGQAVIEGVMMKCGDDYAVAVRKPDQTIEVKKDRYVGLNSRFHTRKIPIIRGILAFVDSMVLGMSTLTYSAGFFDEDESKPEKDTAAADAGGDDAKGRDSKKSGGTLDKLMMGLTVALSIVIAIVLFMLVPLFIASVFGRFISNDTVIAILEGIFRIAIFMIYIVAIAQMDDIQRVFMYHGAEHKTINCIEHGDELTPENAAKYSRLHKRCGTSFMLFVIVISVICFIFIRVDGMLLRIVSRIVLVPFIAGISYEILQWAGNSESRLVQIVSKPGMMLQKLTTREPDLDMLECAIASIEAIYDWRAFQASVAADAGEESGGSCCGGSSEEAAK